MSIAEHIEHLENPKDLEAHGWLWVTNLRDPRKEDAFIEAYVANLASRFSEIKIVTPAYGKEGKELDPAMYAAVYVRGQKFTN